MKNIITTLFILFAILGAAYGQSGYKITGTVEGVPLKEVVLVTIQNDKTDTLGVAEVSDGRFMFEGNTDDIVAYITFPSSGNLIPIMLQNKDFRIDIKPEGIAIEGGEAHRLYNDFSRVAAGLAREQSRLAIDFRLATQKSNRRQMDGIQEELDNIFQRAKDQEQALIAANPDHYVSVYVIYMTIPYSDEERLRNGYELLGPDAKDTWYGKAIEKRLSDFDKIAVGRIAPDFTVMTPEGNKFTLHEVQSKLKLVYFWSSEDNASRADNTGLIALYRHYRPRGLEIISISLDTDQNAWRQAVGLDGMVWRNGSDLQGYDSKIVSQYCITSVPYTFLIDESNRIVAKDIRGKDLSKKIGDLLRKK